jgi:hypothetical protein
MALILDGTNGLSDVDGSAATPAIRGSDANTGVFFGTDIVGVSTGGSERVRVDASGNVGIGTSSPANKLDINTVNGGPPAVRVYGNDQSHNRIRLENIGSGGRIWDIVGGLNGASNSFFSIYDATAAATRVAIDSSGNLLVGTTSRLTGERLSVAASGSGNNTCVFKFDSTDDRAIVISLHAGSSGGTSRKHYAFLDAGGFERGSIGVNGSSTSYVTSSDYRLKENIAPMTGALGVVQQLKPCTYTWKNGGIAGQGFIAHELQEVVPECVTGEKDAVDAEGNPQYQGIDTSFLVATLTAAIQEQQALIASQSEIISAQQTALTALTARVEAQEVRLTSLEGAQA